MKTDRNTPGRVPSQRKAKVALEALEGNTNSLIIVQTSANNGRTVLIGLNESHANMHLMYAGGLMCDRTRRFVAE